MDPSERRFAKEQQAQSLRILREKLKQSPGALEKAERANESFVEQLARQQREGVDVLPEIAQAVAWRNIGVPAADTVVEKGTGKGGGQFEVKVSESGMVSVVPKKQLSPRDLSDFVFDSLRKDPHLTVAELKAQNPHLFPAPALLRGPEKRGDAFWTRNTFNDSPHWWWPGSWIKYAKALTDLSRGRYEIMATGRHKDIDMLPPEKPEPVLQLTVAELAERMHRVESLHEQRATLLNKLREVEGEMKTLGIEVAKPTPSLAATMDARRADGARLGFQALGIATLIVGASAVVGAYVFSKRTGVTDVEGFKDWATSSVDSEWYQSRATTLSSAIESRTPTVANTTVGSIVQKTSLSLAGVRGGRETIPSDGRSGEQNAESQ